MPVYYLKKYKLFDGVEFPRIFLKFLRIQRKKNLLGDEDSFLCSKISKITGLHPKNVKFYREAFSVKNASKNSEKLNYERLEFLGDSILGSIISCYLFHVYPEVNEGYLTQMKSKIVNRKNLNKLGESLNLKRFIRNEIPTTLSENISGNLFEALIGAIYLDYGYEVCKKIVLEKLLTASEILKLENKIISYKSLLLEWSQKKKVHIRYETCEETRTNKCIVFRSSIWIGEDKISNAAEASKKKAEEKAAQRAFYILNKKRQILEKQKINS